MTFRNNDKHYLKISHALKQYQEAEIENCKKAWRNANDFIRIDNKKLSLVEWSEKYRVLPIDAAESGKMKFARTPYMRGIAASLDSIDPAEQIVIVKKGGQLGFSELAVSLIGKTIHQSPTNIMFIQETEDKIRKTVKNRILPMIRRRVFSGAIEQGEGQGIGKGKGKISQKEISFAGGMLTLWGSNAAASYSSTSAGIVILDEFARYPKNVQMEGDPLSLAMVRMDSYGMRGKLYVPSTPVEGDDSEGSFEAVYQLGDCRQYYMPCPECGHEDYFRRDRFVSKNVSGEIDGFIVCTGCGILFNEFEYKTVMLNSGVWRGTKERDSYNITSYQVPALLSPLGWLSWKQIAQRLENAKRGKTALRPVVNLAFGESFTEELDIADTPHIIKEHTTEREVGIVPDAVAFLTMAVDIQRGWMAYEVKGWAEREFSFSIEQGILEIDLSQDAGYIKLRNLIRRKWAKLDGAKFNIEVVAIDSGDGQSTNEVYKFASDYPQPIQTKRGWVIQSPRTVIAVKGGNRIDPTQIIERASKIKGRAGLSRQINLWTIGTSIPKIQLYKALSYSRDDENHNMVNYPAAYPKEWFAQLTAEPVIPVADGKTGKRRVKFGKPKGRNEALDLHVYNRAAAEIFGISNMTKKRYILLKNRGKNSTGENTTGEPPIPTGRRRKRSRDNRPFTI